jgi:hypothetical protein
LFLSNFLSGDLTVRFTLKASVLLVVASGIFWYYLGTVGQEPVTPTRTRIFGWTAFAAIVIALGLGFAVIGSPARQRAISLDDQRLTRVVAIARDINLMWDRHKGAKFTLPRSLDKVLAVGVEVTDPATGQLFEYFPQKGTSYRLCANFDASRTFQSPGQTAWDHPAGHYCYSIDAQNEVANLWLSFVAR